MAGMPGSTSQRGTPRLRLPGTYPVHGRNVLTKLRDARSKKQKKAQADIESNYLAW
jgi:hypothetical protein